MTYSNIYKMSLFRCEDGLDKDDTYEEWFSNISEEDMYEIAMKRWETGLYRRIDVRKVIKQLQLIRSWV